MQFEWDACRQKHMTAFYTSDCETLHMSCDETDTYMYRQITNPALHIKQQASFIAHSISKVIIRHMQLMINCDTLTVSMP